MTLVEVLKNLFKQELSEKILFKKGNSIYTYGDVAKMVLKVKEETSKTEKQYLIINSINSPETFILFYASLLSGKTIIPLESDLDIEKVIKSLGIEPSECIKYYSSVEELQANLIGNGQVYSSEVEVVTPKAVYIMRTSGTTSLKKAFAIGVNEIEAFLCGCSKFFGFAQGLKFVSLFDLHFDLAFFNLLIPLMNRGEIFFPQDKLEQLFPIDLLFNSGADVVLMTPSHSTFIQDVRHDFTDTSLSRVIFCGEILREANYSYWNRYKNVEIYNVYGPAETTVFASAKKIIKYKKNFGFSIGQPFEGVEFEIIDDNLHIIGEQVGHFGYLNSLDDSFYKKNKKNAFRTSDIVKVDEAGEMYILGRSDSNIKIQGKWLNLNQVENVVLENKLASEVAAVQNENSIGYTLFVVVGERNASEDDVSNKICHALNYNISLGVNPSKIVFLNRMPINSNFKVDRASLKRYSQK